MELIVIMKLYNMNNLLVEEMKYLWICLAKYYFMLIFWKQGILRIILSLEIMECYKLILIWKNVNDLFYYSFQYNACL